VGLAALLAAGGVAALTIAGDVADDTAVHLRNVLLVGAGTVALILGVLLLSPLAVRALGSAARPLPLPARLALRDLGRYQARSGAALAAVSLALGAPLAVVIGAAAAQPTAATGNLSDHHMLIRTAGTEGPFVPQPEALARPQAGVDQIASDLGRPKVIRLDVALNPAAEPQPGIDDRPVLSLATRAPEGWRDITMIYVVTADLLAPHDIDVDSIDPGVTLLTAETAEVRLIGGTAKFTQLDQRIHLERGYTSLPGSFVTVAQLETQGWERVPSGQWLLETAEPITEEQRASALEIAAATGLTIETRDDRAGLAKLRNVATGVGALIALGVLAMTVGLIRSEAAGDLRTLTAVGASSSTRRTITAATAGGLAVLGVLLGTLGAYTVLAAGPFIDASALARAPFGNLAIIILGTPVIAAAAGWLLAGRDPGEISEPPPV